MFPSPIITETYRMPVLLSLSQIHASDFAANGLWQLREELDFTRIFVRRGDPLAVFLQVVLELFAGRIVLAYYDEGLDDSSSNRVHLAHHRGFDHRRML